MGIRGLTTFITQNSDRFHQRYKLHDCYLVIDGSSLASQLHNRVSKCNSAFGGDYDEYAHTIENFFSLLTQCNVTPLVVLDGGYEMRKLKTVWTRMKSKIHNASVCNPVTQSGCTVFPLLMREVFKQVLKKINVRFAQADFEADDEIAAIARHHNCPVLSYDSDFYVYDVLYIPFSTMDLEPVKVRKSDGSHSYVINCELYTVERFVKHFGGLDKSLMPLMATLLGNDYVPRRLFNKFFNHVKLGKGKKNTFNQRKILAIFEWLRKENMKSAINKILSHLRKHNREYVLQQIQRSIAGYTQCSSELLSILGVSCSTEAEPMTYISRVLSVSSECVNDECNSESESSSYSSTSSDDDEENCNASYVDCDENEAVKLTETKKGFNVTFPKWLQNKFRNGELSSFLSDMFFLQKFFSQPQVEDFTLPDSHVLSFSILQAIYGLLTVELNENEVENEGNVLTCYIRSNRAKAECVNVTPLYHLPNVPNFPPLCLLHEVPIEVRRTILYDSLNMGLDDIKIIDAYPDKWKLFALTVVFWARNAKSPGVTNCHIHALVLCMVSLGVVDVKVGYFRSKGTLMKKMGAKVRKAQQNSEPQAVRNTIPSSHNIDVDGESNEDTSLLIKKFLDDVTEDDCLRIAETLYLFRHVEEKLKSSPRQFSTMTVHAFAQLQTCLLQAMNLNSLLNHPVPHCDVAFTYSGTIAYTAFSNFNRRTNVEAYIYTLMKDSITVWRVYEATYSAFRKLLPNMSVLVRKGKRSKKKVHQAGAKNTCNHSSDEGILSDETENHVLDVNNKFSLLGAL